MTDEPTPARPLDWQRAAIRDQELPAATVPVIAALVTLAPGKARPGKASAVDGWDFFAAVKTLAGLARVGVSTVERALSTLRAAGYLHQVRRGGQRGTRAMASTWRLTLPTHPAGGIGPRPNPSPVTDRGTLADDPQPVISEFPTRHQGGTKSSKPTKSSRHLPTDPAPDQLTAHVVGDEAAAFAPLSCPRTPLPNLTAPREPTQAGPTDHRPRAR